MSSTLAATRQDLRFPRYFSIGGHSVSAYKIFLCIGVYVGTLVSAGVAQRSGISPLRMGIACIACAVIGMIGARLFHVVVHLRRYLSEGLDATVWNSRRGGWSVFGGLVIVPFSGAVARWLQIPFAVYWDHLIIGIVTGAVFIRFGCVCNGCCSGRPTASRYGIRQHDIGGRVKRRVPVQWLEITWWLSAVIGLWSLWPYSFPPGTYAAGALCWYGVGRFWLEPLREQSDVVARVRVNQLVAALLALVTGSVLVALLQE